jgi:hypothetical protein
VTAAFVPYGAAIEALADSSLGFGALRAVMCTALYAPDPIADATYSDIAAFEHEDDGNYTVGGAAVTETAERTGSMVTVRGSTAEWPAPVTAATAVLVADADGDGILQPDDRLVVFSVLAGGAVTSTRRLTLDGPGILSIAPVP